MNDLEHDLRQLFEHRATDVDVPGLAPKDVLRRGRRRQVGTVVTSVLACLVALGATAAAVGQARHPAVIPEGGNGLPARTTSIGGVPVTAPAGWTLVDDWPLAAILATTSQTCSFTGTGSAVSENGSPVDGGTTASPASSGGTIGQSCTSTQVGYPAGVPVLQLANFEVPVVQTVCGLADQAKPATIPPDGVAVYVADDQAQADIPALLEACAGNGGSLLGEPQTFFDVGQHTDYIAVAFAGPNASTTDIDTARHYVDGLSGVTVTPSTPASVRGPGYVVAAGVGGDTSWRLEPGITSFDRQSGAPTVGAVMVTTTGATEASRTVDLPTARPVNDDYVDLGRAGVVQFGTASAAVTAIDIDLPSGGAVAATMFPWPALAIPNLPAADGSIWFAQTPERGDVHASLPPAPPSAPTLSPSSEAGQLGTRQTANGDIVIYGHDLGHEWEIRHQDGAVEFFVDGAQDPAQAVSFDIGLETEIDVNGGTFLLAVLDPTVHSLTVTTDASDTRPTTTIDGRWAAAQDNAGHQARIWLLPLPGSGTGTEQHNSDLPTFVSWPTKPLHQGSSFNSISDGTVSWTLRYRDDHCVQLVTLGADPGNSGTSDCLPPWQDLGNDPLVGGVYGSTRATVAVVVTHRPATSVTSPDLNTAELQCVDVDVESHFAGTTFCVFPVEVGQSVTLDLAQSGGPPNLNEPITVTARSGSIDLGGSGSATAAATP
ncbi:MAG TPA: hypothetical protein VHW68_11335 [Actinomycetota bacterium]|jgi:hypothetical protein|nr:hypothetical protein [Actinomycetota bacterium]